MRLEGAVHLASRGMSLGKLCLILWAVVVVVVAVRSFFWPRTHTVYPIFAQAARDWVENKDAYFPERDRNLDQYRYSPLVSVLLIPFSLLPDTAGGVLWRLLNVGVLLGGFVWFCRCISDSTPFATCRPLLLLLLLPLSIGSLNNGQANLLVVGLLMLGVSACAVERWNLAAVVVALACFIKLYPLAVGLLLIVAFPKHFSWRFAIAVVLGLAAPCAFQDLSYTTQAYASWVNRLGADQRTFSADAAGYRDMWLLLKTAGAPVTRGLYLVIQLGAAVAVAVVCALGRRRAWSNYQLAESVFALGCCWMVLLGPATESCTYCFLAPVLAFSFADKFRPGEPVWTRWWISAILAVLLASQVSRWFPQGRDFSSPLLPLGGLLLFADQLFVSAKRLFVSHVCDRTSNLMARAA